MTLTSIHRIEREIIERLVRAILDDGRAISVFDGEEVTLASSTDAKAIAAVVGATDETTLFVTEKGGTVPDGKVFLVHGNEDDVIADYSVALGRFVAAATLLTEDAE